MNGIWCPFPSLCRRLRTTTAPRNYIHIQTCCCCLFLLVFMEIFLPFFNHFIHSPPFSAFPCLEHAQQQWYTQQRRSRAIQAKRESDFECIWWWWWWREVSLLRMHIMIFLCTKTFSSGSWLFAVLCCAPLCERKSENLIAYTSFLTHRNVGEEEEEEKSIKVQRILKLCESFLLACCCYNSNHSTRLSDDSLPHEWLISC